MTGQSGNVSAQNLRTRSYGFIRDGDGLHGMQTVAIIRGSGPSAGRSLGTAHSAS
jgi:hypothetical protein